MMVFETSICVPRRSSAARLCLFLALLVWACEEPPSTPEDAFDEVTPDADTTPPQTFIGEPCGDDPDCEGGFCATLLPGGACTRSCSSLEPCPDGAVCQTLGGFDVCLRACDVPADCREAEGYTCVDGGCTLACFDDVECDAGERCVEGRCEATPEGQLVGQPCAAPSDCRSGLCLDAGLCTQRCDAAACPRGWACEGALCAPPPPSGVDSLSPEPVDARTWSFTVGPDVVSLLIVAEAENPRAVVTLQNIIAPDGRVIAGESRDGYTEPLRLFSGQGHNAALIPQNNVDALQVTPGTWSFQLSLTTGVELRRLQVFLTRRDDTGDEPTAGVFDLNLFIPPGVIDGLTAESAPDSAHLRGALLQLEQLWAPHGLSIGEVRFFALPEEMLVHDSQRSILEMFATTTATLPDEGALNVFLSRELRGNLLQGFAGGIPGAVGLNGSTGAGLAIVPQALPTSTGDNIAHELGHLLGLFHVSGDGALHDVIADTPECQEPISSAPFDDPSDCWRNIMYPILLTGFVPQRFSPTQGRVLRLNPRAGRP